jgi:hypothetical protein
MRSEGRGAPLARSPPASGGIARRLADPILPGALQDATGPRKGLRPPEGTTKDATTSFGPTARTTAVNEGGIMSEPSRALPPRPSLEQQQKLAKELLKALRAGDAEARGRTVRDRARVRL